jgi:hypothetical protein
VSKRSTQIEIAFVSAVAAAALAGCNADAAYHRDWEQCVNQANVVVADNLCDPRAQGLAGAPGGYYHWWYSPRPYGLGSYIAGGYATPLAGSSVARSSSAGTSGGSRGASAVSRGGFGSSAHPGGGG